MGAALLFLLGGAIATLLPRPLQEDKRAASSLKKHKHAKGRSKTESGGIGSGGHTGKSKNK